MSDTTNNIPETLKVAGDRAARSKKLVNQGKVRVIEVAVTRQSAENLTHLRGIEFGATYMYHS